MKKYAVKNLVPRSDLSTRIQSRYQEFSPQFLSIDVGTKSVGLLSYIVQGESESKGCIRIQSVSDRIPNFQSAFNNPHTERCFRFGPGKGLRYCCEPGAGRQGGTEDPAPPRRRPHVGFSAAVDPLCRLSVHCSWLPPAGDLYTPTELDASP